MKLLMYCSLISALIITGCEDKKKASAVQKNISSEKNVDTTVVDSVEKKISAVKNTYPEITNDNVVQFLTDYGKNNPETKVKLTTNHGNIMIELFKDTPLHRANFIYLVKQGYFDNTYFHRIVPNFIIQGGNADEVSVPRKRTKIGADYLIPSELVHSHTYGTVSGAKEYRENPNKKTFPFEFFIFLGPQTSTRHLEGNYTVFGKVIEGMNVVEQISNLPADKAQWPKQNVFMTAEVVE